MDALLATYVPAGKPVSLAPAVLAGLEQALRRPDGFASSEALRHWVRQPHGMEVQDQDARPHRPYALSHHAQGATPQPHKKILRPFPRSRLPVEHASGRSSHPPLLAPSLSSAQTNAASAS
jgi:hypothetical protein